MATGVSCGSRSSKARAWALAAMGTCLGNCLSVRGRKRDVINSQRRLLAESRSRTKPILLKERFSNLTGCGHGTDKPIAKEDGIEWVG